MTGHEHNLWKFFIFKSEILQQFGNLSHPFFAGFTIVLTPYMYLNIILNGFTFLEEKKQIESILKKKVVLEPFFVITLATFKEDLNQESLVQ